MLELKEMLFASAIAGEKSEAETADLSNYYTKTEVDDKIALSVTEIKADVNEVKDIANENKVLIDNKLDDTTKYAMSDSIGGNALKAIADESGENIATNIANIKADVNEVKDIANETKASISKVGLSNDYADLDNKPTSLPASDVSEWAKGDKKPTYTAAEVEADPKGSADSALLSAKSYTDTKVSKLITMTNILTLSATAWTDNFQTVSVSINTANRNVIDVNPESLEEWGKCGVYASAESSTGVTFTCKEVPETDLNFKVTSMVVNANAG